MRSQAGLGGDARVVGVVAYGLRMSQIVRFLECSRRACSRGAFRWAVCGEGESSGLEVGVYLGVRMGCR